VGDGVGFEGSGAKFIPLLSFDRDMFSDEGSRFGGCSASFLIFDPSRKQEAVDRRGRRASEASEDRGSKDWI